MSQARHRKTLEHRDLLSGLVRLHVLHHASEQEIFGQWMMDELAGHSYLLSPGTLYPMLHNLERKGYLVSRSEQDGRVLRKYYRTTEKGLEALALVKARLRTFIGEVMDQDTQEKERP